MASETAFPGTASSDGTDGGIAWTNVNNWKAQDGSFATALVDPFGVPYTERGVLTNFAWSSMQSADTLTALTLNIKRKASANGECKDFHIFFIQNGTISGNDMADLVTFYTTTNTEVSYDVISLSGLSISCSDLRTSTTGIYIVAQTEGLSTARTISGDSVSLTATYTPAAGATSHNLTLLGVGS